MHPYRQVDVGEMPLSLIADQTKYFLEGLFNTFPTEMSMRKLKMIIREASSAYRIMQLDGHKPDWLIVLCVQSTKHFRDHYTQPNKSPTYYDLFVKDKKLLASRSNAFFANTISAITDGRKQDKDLPQSVIIGNPNISAKGHDFIIDDSLISESRPVPRRVDRGRFEFYIPGYYFRY